MARQSRRQHHYVRLTLGAVVAASILGFLVLGSGILLGDGSVGEQFENAWVKFYLSLRGNDWNGSPTGQIQKGYTRICARTRHQLDLDTFKAEVEGGRLPFGATSYSGVSELRTSNTDGWIVVNVSTAKDRARFKFIVRLETGSWKLCDWQTV